MDFLSHFCWWDIPGLILLIVITVLYLVERHKLQEERKKLEGQMPK